MVASISELLDMGLLGLVVYLFNTITTAMYMSIVNILAVFSPLAHVVDNWVSPLKEVNQYLHLMVLALVQCGCMFLGIRLGIMLVHQFIIISRRVYAQRRLRWKAASKLYACNNVRYKTFSMEEVEDRVDNLPQSTMNTILNATAYELRALMAKESIAGGISPVDVLSVFFLRARMLGREASACTVSE
jgi:hypothetical protein